MSVRIAQTRNELAKGLAEDLQSFASKINEKNVLIKASSGYPKPPPFTVDIEIVKETARICRRLGAKKISIIEGSTALDGARTVANTLGFESVEGAEFVDADDTPITKIHLQNRIHWDYLYLPKIVLDSDFRISIAVLKIEDGAKFYSGVIKNLLGMPPRRIYRGKRPWARGKLHQSLHASILDLVRTTNFDYGILDATLMLRGMANMGKKRQFGKYYFGTDLIKIDKTALSNAGYEQAFAPFIKYLPE
ncbi:MAG: DUF362 domain-containing protein [Thaumarchaeota archaeon]|nr:DUF362 domain-containing protein [Nitrososphaerota archaeon]